MSEKLEILNKRGEPRPHGRQPTYRAGCRCDECREAVRDQARRSAERRRARISEGTVEIRHGTTTGYYTDGCRCDDCKDAYRAHSGARPDNLRNPNPVKVEFTPNGRPATHGRVATYARGCRCDECRIAHGAKAKKDRDRQVKGLKDGTLNPKHGKYNTYTNYGCRCNPCQEAARTKRKADAERRKSGYVRAYRPLDQVRKPKDRMVKELRDGTRERVTKALAEILDGQEAMHCTRVWEAWGYGTMSEDDFSLVTDDPDALTEIVDAVMKAINPDKAAN